MKAAQRGLKLLIDTNVWLEYFLERSNRSASWDAIRKAHELYDLMTITPNITKDVFFTVASDLKGRMREDGLEITSGLDGGSNVAAWACLKLMQELALVLNVGMPEHYGAMKLAEQYPDYEDNLLLATAYNNKLDYIITNDKRLLKNEVVAAITPQEYLELDRS